LRLDFDMALIMGTSPMLVGREGEGSRALSEDQSRNLYLMVNATLDDMVESYQRDVVDRVWAMNGLAEELKPS
jgi:phage portal protein BeeE